MENGKFSPPRKLLLGSTGVVVFTSGVCCFSVTLGARMSSSDRTERFIRHLTEVQEGLLAFILSLVGDSDAAADVLQDTNVVLWRKFDEFEEGTSFGAWSRAVALYQVRAWRRDAARERLLFDDELLEAMVGPSETAAANLDERSAALEQCVGKLPADQQELLRLRYQDANTTLSWVATAIGKSVPAVAMALSRIRHGLLECVRRQLTDRGGESA